MRWFWVDRFIEFERGESARAIKNVSLAEEHLHDHFPGFPVMPQTLMLEGMAQTGGTVLGSTQNFDQLVFLAKVPKITFHAAVRPGDQLIYSARLEDVREGGGMTSVQAHVGDQLVAEGEIFFAMLDPADSELPATVQQKELISAILGEFLNQD